MNANQVHIRTRTSAYTPTHKFTGYLAARWLERFDSTYNGDNSYTINYWDYDANTCNHYDITRDEHGDIEIPAELMKLYHHPRHISRREWNERKATLRKTRR